MKSLFLLFCLACILFGNVYAKDSKYYESFATKFFTGKVKSYIGESFVQISEYKDGYLDGPTKTYYADGKLRGTIVYKNNVSQSMKLWSRKNVLEADILFKDEKPYEGFIKEFSVDEKEISHLKWVYGQVTGWEYSYKEDVDDEYTKKPFRYKKFYVNGVVTKLIALNLYDKEIPKKSNNILSGESLGNKWKIDISKDVITGNTNVVLGIDAEGYFGKFKENPHLVLSCKNNETDMYINWNAYLGNKAYVTSRIGTNKAKKIKWELSKDKNSSFYPGTPIPLIREMVKYDKVIFEVIPYNEGPIKATFDTKGLEILIQPLIDTCGWELVKKEK